MGTRAGFRVILHREDRQRFVAQSGNGAIVEVEMGDFHVGVWQRLGTDGKPMILAGYFHVLLQSAGLD